MTKFLGALIRLGERTSAQNRQMLRLPGCRRYDAKETAGGRIASGVAIENSVWNSNLELHRE
ncbi:MAG: hypothetical protein GXP19_10275 [Gammaproteobacteria bacterium]|nr:hypothetical protein [Gammaproteobacteria bacterium]